MQKVIDILEQHVQWIAIGLGALFVLFMTWTYVIHPPAEVQIGGETLTAGEVDAYSQDHEGKALEQALQNHEHISVAVPNFADAFKNSMDWKNAKPVELADMWNPQTKDVTLPASANPTNPANPGSTNSGPILAGDKVKALPHIPAVVLADTKFGRSVISPPQANGQPAPPPEPAQPGQPAVATGVDKDWLTQLFMINMTDLNKSFEDAKIPPAFSKTVFLQVEMERQEQLPDGSWGANGVKDKSVVIPPIGVYRSQQPPPPFPAEGAPREQDGVYLQWASSNTPDILQPLFYTVIKGDQWSKPGTQAAGQGGFNPDTFTGDVDSLPKDQREMVMKARRDAYKKKQEDAQKSHPRPAAGGPGGGAAGPGRGVGAPPAFAPNPNYAPGSPRQAPPPFAGANSPGAAVGGPVGMGPMDGGIGGVTPASLPQPGVDYPNGVFDPSQWKDKTIEGWVHDDTVVAGKTYRYRIRYKIQNPVFAAGNLTDPLSLANQFALVSDWCNWGDPVAVPALVNFFVATGKAANSNSIWFDVFRWDQGEQKVEQFQVGPGDEVGYSKNGIDFDTKWMVVDFRDDPRTGETQIILADTDGKLTTRSFRTDQNDPLYRALKDQINQQRIAAQAVAAGAAGAVGAAGGPR